MNCPSILSVRFNTSSGFCTTQVFDNLSDQSSDASSRFEISGEDANVVGVFKLDPTRKGVTV